MKNLKVMISVDPDDWKAVNSYADKGGLKTANTLASAVITELAKAYKKNLNLWHVLGRISADDPEATTDRKRLPSARPAIELSS